MRMGFFFALEFEYLLVIKTVDRSAHHASFDKEVRIRQASQRDGTTYLFRRAVSMQKAAHTHFTIRKYVGGPAAAHEEHSARENFLNARSRRKAF